MAKINYNGMELEEVTTPQIFDPPKKCVVWDDDSLSPSESSVIAIFPDSAKLKRNVMDLYLYRYQHCALLPDPPKPRRATWTCQGGPMPKDDYPLHPGQTHAEPYYCTIPLEEYENLKDEISHLRSLNETMRAELERRGVIVVPPSAELDKYEKEWVEAELENPKPIITSTDFKEEK